MADRHPDDHQCRHARHPAGFDRASGQELGGFARCRIQGQGRVAGSAHCRGHRCRDGARSARRPQIRQQGKYDSRGDRQDHQYDDGGQEIRAVPLVLVEFRPVGQSDGVGRGGNPVDVVAGRDRGQGARHPVRVPALAGRLPGVGLHAGADEASRRPEARLLLRIHELVHLGLSGRVHCSPGLLLIGPGTRQEVPERSGMGLLVRRQAGHRRYHRPLWQADGESGQHARRRRLLGPHGQYRGVEFGDGRRPLPDPPLERVHHIMTVLPLALAALPQLDRFASASRRLPPWLVSWLQVSPLAFVLVVLFALPTLLFVVVSFWDYDRTGIYPAFVLDNYRDLLTTPATIRVYLSSLVFAVIAWAITLFLGFNIAHFLIFHVRSAGPNPAVPVV